MDDSQSGGGRISGAGLGAGQPGGGPLGQAPLAPAGVDITRPSTARVYDYLLGGSHNFAVDREQADRFLAAVPDTRLMAQENRAFLRRAVRHLAGLGVRQFLDLGSGIPTAGNVHEIAQREVPGARVVYVDIDPVAVAHSRLILAGNPDAAIIHGDLLRPDDILSHPDLLAMIDLDEPVAVLLVAVLHFVLGEEPYRMISAVRERLAPGSFLVVSHATDEHRAEGIAELRRLAQRGGTSSAARSRAEISRLFDGFTLVDPGLVWTSAWHPEPVDVPDEVDEQPHRANLLAGVGRLS